MKFFIVLVSAAHLLFSAKFASAEEKLKTVFEGPWPNTSYRIKLEIPPGWNEQGEFTNLTVTKSGQVVFELKGLQAVALNNVHEFPKGSKSLGKYLKVFPRGPRASGASQILALTNWVGGSNGDELLLIRTAPGRDPKTVFQKTIDLAAIKDFNKDGLYDLLKKGGRGEPAGDNNFAYDPYLVYLQADKGRSLEFKIDEKSSKKWSAENKFAWHGLNSDEKLKVDKNGEPLPQP